MSLKDKNQAQTDGMANAVTASTQYPVSDDFLLKKDSIKFKGVVSLTGSGWTTVRSGRRRRDPRERPEGARRPLSKPGRG